MWSRILQSSLTNLSCKASVERGNTGDLAMSKLIAARFATMIVVFSLYSNVSSEGLGQAVNGGQFSCAELESKVKAAGPLLITANKFDPYGSESQTTNTFVTDTAQCKFPTEVASDWELYGKDLEV